MNNVLQKVIGFTQSKYMRILTNAFMSVAAISIAGSLFMLVKSLPIAPWQSFLTSSGLGDILSIPVSITTDLMAIYIVIAMAYTLAKELKKDAFAAAVIALGAFMILTPFTATTYTPDPATGEMLIQTTANVIPISSVGAQGIFLAILTGLLASRLYIFFIDRGWKIRMPESVPSNVTKMFEMMIPGGLVFVVFLMVRWGFSVTSFETAQKFIYTILQKPLVSVGGGFWGCMVYLTVAKFLWVFGVHGGMVAYASFSTIMAAVMAENASAFAAGTPCPSPEWAWSTVLADFSILALTIVMLLSAKSKQFKVLSKLSLPTSIFNISEPLVFGTPIVMNPIIAIPFVLLQPINLLLTTFMNNIGFLAMPTGAQINNMIPGPIQMALDNGHWSGFVWGVILLAINVLIYMPFFKILDKKSLLEEQSIVADLEVEEKQVSADTILPEGASA